jgi:2,5-diamino-6-(ribosylamino)-4(3H)-pyrimidinone 5'-phosphate reductase
MKPYIFINLASSLDGKISSTERKQLKISNEEDLRRVDRLRAFSDAVMVGIGTILSDDPSLTVKDDGLRKLRVLIGKDENPIRVVIDSRCRIPLEADILQGPGKRIIVTSDRANSQRVNSIKKAVDDVEIWCVGNDTVDLTKTMEKLYKSGVRTLMVEGGGELNFSLIQENLVDEIQIYIGNLVLGGRDAPTIVDGVGFTRNFPKFRLFETRELGEGVLLKWKKI